MFNAFQARVYLFFSIRVFFHGHWWLTGQQGKGGKHLLFHSTTSTHSQTFRRLFATFHVKWLEHIFNRTTCIYQAATRWHLLLYRITIWLIDDVTLIFVCLLDEMMLSFCYSNLTLETCQLELPWTITLALLANRLAKCASHPWIYLQNFVPLSPFTYNSIKWFPIVLYSFILCL